MKDTSQSWKDALILITKIFNAITTTSIGTWNVKTLNQTGKLAQIMKEFKRYILDMLGLSEMR